MFTSDWGNANEIKPLFDPVTAKSRQSWAEELFRAADDEAKFQEVKKASPFAGKTVIIADLASGSRYYGDISAFMHKRGVEIDIASSLIRSAIRNSGHEDGWNRYIIAFDGNDVEKADVFHFGKNEKLAFPRPASAHRKA